MAQQARVTDRLDVQHLCVILKDYPCSSGWGQGPCRRLHIGIIPKAALTDAFDVQARQRRVVLPQ